MVRLGLVLLACLLMTPTAKAADDAARRELAPTGAMRVAIGVGPVAGAFYAVRDPATGQYRGVTVELARALAGRLAVPVRFVPYLGSGEIQNAAGSGTWDVTFMPVDAARKQAVDFGAPYHLLQSTYLVPGASRIRTVADANVPGVRIVGVRDTATFRASQSASPRANHIAVEGPERAVALMQSGEADAIALGRESLTGISEQIPGSRILEQAFLNSTTAIAVPKGRPLAHAFVTRFIEEAKVSGLVRRTFDHHGLQSSVVAPPGMEP
jgi:polar amino acid transport system substrate-binding protein